MMKWLLALSLVVTSLSSVVQARVWTSATGKKVDAEYVGFEDGQVALKFAKTNQVRRIPLSALSAADQAFVMAQQTAQQPSGESGTSDESRFNDLIAKNPDSSSAYYSRGLARLNREDLAGALTDLNKAIELDPKNAVAYDARGQAYAKQGMADKAHNDFEQAIEIDGDLASAYRHRGENLYAYAKTEAGKQYVQQGQENFRKKLSSAQRRNIKQSAWQPLHATKGSAGASPVMVLARADREQAERLERGYRRGGYGVGGGYGAGGPGGPGESSGSGGAGKGPLTVYPEKVTKGETITLTANSDSLEKGMPMALNRAGKPSTAFKGRRKPSKEKIQQVEFYRDANGNGKFDPEGDQLLATDKDASDGYSVEVPTADLPAGKQQFFAMPQGSEQPSPELMSAAEKLEKAAKAESRLAERAEQAAQGQGLTDAQAAALGRTQASVAKTAAEVAEAVAQASPQAAEMLAGAQKPCAECSKQLDSAQANPGAPSKDAAQAAAEQAKAVAQQLASAAAQLKEDAGKPGAGEMAAGKAVAGSGEITPAKPSPSQVAGSGSGGGSGGGATNQDVDQAIERALGYIDEGDYDEAIDEYDRLVERYPDDDYYYRHRADTYLADGRYDYAIRDYDRTIELGVVNADLYYNRGCAYLAAGQVQRAIADFTKSIELDETANLAWNNRGSSYARVGQYDKAVADFTQAIAINAGDHLAYRNRALAYRKLGQQEKAQADLSRAEQLLAK